MVGVGRAAATTPTELDALVQAWTNDSTAARDRTVDIIRRAHLVMGPAVVLGAVLFVQDPVVVIAGIVYLLGLLAVLGFGDRWNGQVGLLAAFDIALMGVAAASDPLVWFALLVPAVAALTAGWLVGPRTTWLLWGAFAVSFGVSGLIAEPTGWLVVFAIAVGTVVQLNLNNLEFLGRGRAGVLRVADLVDSLRVIVWEGDGDTGTISRALGRVEDLVGYSTTEWLELPPARRVHRDDLGEYLARLATAMDDSESASYDYRLRCADGSSLRVRELVSRVDHGGRSVLRGVILDITEEAAARQAVDRLAAVIDRQPQPLVILTPRHGGQTPSILEANPAFVELAGGDELLGRGLDDALAWLPTSVLADLDDHWTHGRIVDRDDIEVQTPRGVRVFDSTIVGLPDGSTAIQWSDVTDRRNATDLIRHQAFHDPLTGLPNRSLLFDRVSQALAGIDRHHETMGLLLLDLDEFKEINDTLGHASGDELLSTIGDRLQGLTRDSDTVARLGGDEFAMVVVGASAGELEYVARRVHDAVKAPVALGGIDVEVAASIGGVLAPVHGKDPHTLLQRADIAMYDAKRSGSGFRLYAPDDDRHSVDRLTLMGELRNLLDGELEVWFQPKVDLRTGRSHDVEALARWNHPRLGLLGPGQFIELCEISGMVAELTFRVLDATVAALAEWPGMRAAVNVPVRNLYDRTLPDYVERCLARHVVEPDRLILEITEREIMEDHRAVVDVLAALDAQGVKLSIDDFGTGFSSLTHLRRLPISEIKIDQSFVAGMLDRENDYIIARSIIDLAHNLGHRVVAEGVEDRATLQLLKMLGCDAAQGFLFARPGPIERMQRLIATGPALDGIELTPAWTASDDGSDG